MRFCVMVATQLLCAIFQPKGGSFFTQMGSEFHMFGFLGLIEPDNEWIITLEHFISPKKWGIIQYMSAILDF